MAEALKQKQRRSQRAGYIIAAILLPVYLVFIFLGKEQLGSSVFIVLGITLAAIWVRRDLRKRLWFWAVIVVLLIAQAPLVFLVRWPHWWGHGQEMLPIALADALIILGVIRFVEKFIVKSPPATKT